MKDWKIMLTLVIAMGVLITLIFGIWSYTSLLVEHANGADYVLLQVEDFDRTVVEQGTKVMYQYKLKREIGLLEVNEIIVTLSDDTELDVTKNSNHQSKLTFQLSTEDVSKHVDKYGDKFIKNIKLTDYDPLSKEQKDELLINTKIKISIIPVLLLFFMIVLLFILKSM